MISSLKIKKDKCVFFMKVYSQSVRRILHKSAENLLKPVKQIIFAYVLYHQPVIKIKKKDSKDSKGSTCTIFKS